MAYTGSVSLLKHPYPHEPLADAVSRILHAAAGNAVSLHHIRPGLQSGNIFYRTGPAAAAMGRKRNYGLPGKIILVKEGIQRHRHLVPPYRITDEYDIIAVEVIYRH